MKKAKEERERLAMVGSQIPELIPTNPVLEKTTEQLPKIYSLNTSQRNDESDHQANKEQDQTAPLEQIPIPEINNQPNDEKSKSDLVIANPSGNPD